MNTPTTPREGAPFQIVGAPGYWFKFITEEDTDTPYPWECEDGHGPVRSQAGSSSPKRPGERYLDRTTRGGWLYDWQAACKIARRDGWDDEPFGAPGRVQRAVQADFDRLRAYVCGGWGYVGVCVVPCDSMGVVDRSADPYAHALWGIESDLTEYHAEVALELAFQCADANGWLHVQRAAAWRAALRDARERRYWAQRGVPTMGEIVPGMPWWGL